MTKTHNRSATRFSTGEPDMLEDMRALASGIPIHADHTRELLELGQRALEHGRKLSGALYLPSAEFFMFEDDQGKQKHRRTYLELIREIYGVNKKRGSKSRTRRADYVELVANSIDDGPAIFDPQAAIEHAEERERIYLYQKKVFAIRTPVRKRRDGQAVASEPLEELDQLPLAVFPSQKAFCDSVINGNPGE